ncbi:pimeloyl-ACP methyl ester carboxylesterase [Rhodococcus sp. OK519]|uniref:alpha/beta fold hydrolase n=1 Tax=Rhodococcus sp. OK519 TaxID=2135729 RepID=UPI000D393D85|nr:pimeloyl-ACP methyl ester carboxylesterase [Rhodococcus sp. OK519]
MHHQSPTHRSISPSARGLAEIHWHDAVVDGRRVPYGTAGSGAPVLFLHGFGLSPRIYASAVERLAATGVQVYAPVLPGFAGTDALPPEEHGFSGYADWVASFVGALGIDAPVTLVGHSFGGGVALASTERLEAQVSQLVLVNSVGGAAWEPDGLVRHLRERPLWRWGVSAAVDAVLARSPSSALAAITGDTLRNAIRNPAGLWRIGELARTADLRDTAASVARRGVPTAMVWSHGDSFIPQASFRSLRNALSDPRVHTVQGCHGWLIGDPDGFGRAMTTVLRPPLSVAV